MKVGSLVECINKNGWDNDGIGPKLKEICTVSGLDYNGSKLYLELLEYSQIDKNGYRDTYFSESFREIQPPMDLSKMLEETLQLQEF